MFLLQIAIFFYGVIFRLSSFFLNWEALSIGFSKMKINKNNSKKLTKQSWSAFVSFQVPFCDMESSFQLV
jgi:hypothetical protein